MKLDQSEIEKLSELFAPEELHPALIPYLQNGALGQYLKHPLVFSVPYSPVFNRHLNGLYLQKIKALEEAIKERNWNKYVFLHERPCRVEALMEVVFDFGVFEKPETYWPLVRSVWIDSENIAAEYNNWCDLLLADGEQEDRWAHLMTDDERAFLRAAPQRLMIYRGAGNKEGLKGLSWTIDREKAEWFARRFPILESHDPWVAVGTVSKSSVYAYFSSRGESEFVTLPDDVTVIETYQPKARGRVAE